jgi:hypothetical protein
VFITTALRGTSSERNTSASITAVTPSTRATMSGNFRVNASRKSSAEGAKPPTSILAFSSVGYRWTRMRRTSRTAWSAPSSVTVSRRKTSKTVVEPSRLR